MKMPVRLYLWTALLSPKILALPVDGRLQYEKTKDFPAAFFFPSNDATTVAALGNVAVILGGLYLLSWIETGPTEKSESFYKGDRNLNIINNKLRRIAKFEKETFMEKQPQYSENESKDPGSFFGLPTLEEINPFKMISPVIQNILSFTSKPKQLKPIGLYQERQIPQKLQKKKLFKKYKIFPELRSPMKLKLEESDPYFLKNQYTDDEFNNHYHHEEETSLFDDWKDMVALAEREAMEFQFDRIAAPDINTIHTTETIPTSSAVTTSTSSTKTITSVATSATTTSTILATSAKREALEFKFDRVIAQGIKKIHTTGTIPTSSAVTTSTSSTKIVTSVATSTTTTSTILATSTSATNITSTSATINNENMSHLVNTLTSSFYNNIEIDN